MQMYIYDTQDALAADAAKKAAEKLKEALKKKKKIRIVAATGNAQLAFLDCLRKEEGIDWSRVELFHLDEYVGISKDHPASFAGYIEHHIIEKMHPGFYRLIHGAAEDIEKERRSLSEAVSEKPIDVALVGIGENGHLAFNDPPADFETEEPYIIVELDQACRMQQVGEGWFPSLEAVPKFAVTMSMKQILSSGSIMCIVPEKRKAQAVRNCLSETAEISPMHPASLLKTHGDTQVFLDRESASLLEETP